MDTTKTITNRLFELQDKEYGDFSAKLTPTLPREAFIGVRVPAVRTLAKQLCKEGGYEDFLNTLPHQYYDENMLHGLLLSEMKDYNSCIAAVDKFLPYVDNWAVCDIMSPKIFKKNRASLINDIRRWTQSELTYTRRFGMEMLMSHFLDEEFAPEYLEIPAAVHSDEYYVNMMTAWFFATALAKQWKATLPYIQNNRLDLWVHNKAIQKSRESNRISSEKKELLLSLKRES